MMTIDPSVPFWLLALLFVPITIFLLWKEWGRKLTLRIPRVIAALIMMLMLAAIFLRPHYNVTKSRGILLLTNGYNIVQIDSLVTAHPDVRVINTPGTERYKDSRPLKSYYELRDLDGNVEFIAGEGLPRHALPLLDKKNFTFLPGKRPSGIVELSTPTQIIKNRQSRLSGTFRNISDEHAIFLMGPGGKEDSVTIATKGTTSFTLSFTPRQAGELLYTLSVKDTKGNSQEDNVPIIVDNFSPLTVLIVLSYPTFETTFLKNFIVSRGNKLVLRSQLSRNNFGYEYVNHEPLRFSTLSKNVLDGFDLLIADQATLQRLSNQESSVLRQSIKSGLGLLAIYDGAPKEKAENNFFPFRTISVKGDTTTLNEGSKKYTLPVLPFRVVSERPLQTVLRNESGILSGYTLSGKGKIGFQLTQQTYRLMLAGDTIAYGDIWSPLLERIARPLDQTASVEFANPFPYYVDEPLHIKLISSADAPALLTDSVRIPIREDVQVDDVWHGTIWPSTPGWHTLQIDGRPIEYYVANDNEWRSLAIENQMKDNDLVWDKDQGNNEKTKDQRPIPPVWFFTTLIIAAGFLWLAPKL
jgi:hypothetical protein